MNKEIGMPHLTDSQLLHKDYLSCLFYKYWRLRISAVTFKITEVDVLELGL